jgi:hypothetical protein
VNAADLPALLRAQADALAVQVTVLRAMADAIEGGGAAPACASPRYATATHNPIGSARAFLDAARAHKFPTFKRARAVCALWSDVEAWIESKKRAAPARNPNSADDDRAILDAAGLRPKPHAANDRGRR